MLLHFASCHTHAHRSNQLPAQRARANEAQQHAVRARVKGSSTEVSSLALLAPNTAARLAAAQRTATRPNTL
eukprot:1725853-Rhodomonas_salina.2